MSAIPGRRLREWKLSRFICTHVRIYVWNYCTWIALDTPLVASMRFFRYTPGTPPYRGKREKRERRRKRENGGIRERARGMQECACHAHLRIREGGLRHGGTSGHLATPPSLSPNVILFRDVRSVRERRGESRKTYEEKRSAVGYAARLNAPGYAKGTTVGPSASQSTSRIDKIASLDVTIVHRQSALATTSGLRETATRGDSISEGDLRDETSSYFSFWQKRPNAPKE